VISTLPRAASLIPEGLHAFEDVLTEAGARYLIALVDVLGEALSLEDVVQVLISSAL